MFTADFKPQPYWWDVAPPTSVPDKALPKSVDVLIIGSGYTGLHAALQTTRAGLATLVVDAQAIGFGASTRNGGQISTSIKPSFATLKRRYGDALATALLQEGRASLDYIAGFVADEAIACDFQPVGRFHGAHNARQYEKMVKEAQATGGVDQTDAFVVPKSEQHRELGTEAYFGGIVYPHHASINPGLYHQGLVQRVHEAGAEFAANCKVHDLERQANGYRAVTEKGEVMAKQVIVATNGYTGRLTPWQQRRVIPIGSYVIATEELPAAVMDRLMPTNRVLSDTRKLIYYYRPSPDRKRILFGGRVSLGETDPLQTGPKLRAELVRLFPELADIRISHSWSGMVAYTFDTLAHAGGQDGLYFAMGYCGSGVGMSSYLGMKIGHQVVGNPSGSTAFSQIPFPTRPFYTGNPWFLAPSIMAYRLRDRMPF